MRRFLVADPQQLRCRECGAVYAAGPIYVCEKCFGPLEAIYDYEALARQPLRRVIESGPPSIWRYEPLLPVNRVPEIDLSPGDRKSTRLNSSHVKISYAVFCLKKKKKKRT